MRFRHVVVNRPAFAAAVQKAAPLHQPQVVGRYGLRHVADFGQLADRVGLAGQQQLNNPQSLGVSQDSQAFGSFGQGRILGPSCRLDPGICHAVFHRDIQLQADAAPIYRFMEIFQYIFHRPAPTVSLVAGRPAGQPSKTASEAAANGSR